MGYAEQKASDVVEDAKAAAMVGGGRMSAGVCMCAAQEQRMRMQVQKRFPAQAAKLRCFVAQWSSQPLPRVCCHLFSFAASQ